MLCTEKGINYMMKKLSMRVAALMTVAPAPFVIDAVSSDPIIIILIIVLLSWACVEFYIGLSRPCDGNAPSHPLVKIRRRERWSWASFSNYYKAKKGDMFYIYKARLF
jgi:hypothetical protein